MHQVLLHLNFVDFKAAFDIIWRWALWKMLRYIGMDPKITSLIEAMYDNVGCAVVNNGQLTEWFRVEIGVRQGCLLTPILFSLFLEFVMADVKSLCKKFKLFTNLSFDISYADDTTIMSTEFEKLQLSNEDIQAACRKWGMKLNFF